MDSKKNEGQSKPLIPAPPPSLAVAQPNGIEGALAGGPTGQPPIPIAGFLVGPPQMQAVAQPNGGAAGPPLNQAVAQPNGDPAEARSPGSIVAHFQQFGQGNFLFFVSVFQ